MSRPPPPLPVEIRRARVAAGLSQTEAAAILYRSYRCWWDWERGEKPMRPELWELWRVKVGRMIRIERR